MDRLLAIACNAETRLTFDEPLADWICFDSTLKNAGEQRLIEALGLGDGNEHVATAVAAGRVKKHS